MSGFLKRYRDLIATVVLLVTPFIIYLAYAKQGRDLTRADRLIISATGPVERALETTLGGLQDAWGNYVALRQVRQDNQQLRSQILHLQEENLHLQEARAENDRLRQMLDFARSLPSTAIPAQVIGTGLSPFLYLRISRGSQDGLRKGMAVVTPSGVVGKIQQTDTGYSDVLLMEDVYSQVAVEDQRTRARATARGAGEARTCKLENAEMVAQIEDGDLLLTSGTDGVFPKGLAVGRVSHLDRRKRGLYVTGEIVPMVDVSQVEEVMVLTDAAEPRAAADRIAPHTGSLP